MNEIASGGVLSGSIFDWLDKSRSEKNPTTLAKLPSWECQQILFGYRDGVTDAESPTGEKFTTEKLLSLLDQYSDSTEALLEDTRAIVMSDIDEAVQFDRITMLAVCRES